MITSRKAEGLTEILEKIDSLISTGPREFYTIDETCKVLGISRTTLYYLRTTGKLESRLIGVKKVVITKRSIDTLVFGGHESNRVGHAIECP